MSSPLGQVTDDGSIFTYGLNENVAAFSNPDHVPPFLDEIISNLERNSTLTEMCGNNLQCLFDLDQTGDVNVGMDTLQFEEETMKQVSMLGKTVLHTAVNVL